MRWPLARIGSSARRRHRPDGRRALPAEQIDKEWGALQGWAQGEAWKRRIRHIPLGRPEKAEDVAGVVAFFAGPDSDYMTGQALNVDGGIVMGN